MKDFLEYFIFLLQLLPLLVFSQQAKAWWLTLLSGSLWKETCKQLGDFNSLSFELLLFLHEQYVHFGAALVEMSSSSLLYLRSEWLTLLNSISLCHGCTTSLTKFSHIGTKQIHWYFSFIHDVASKALAVPLDLFAISESILYYHFLQGSYPRNKFFIFNNSLCVCFIILQINVRRLIR